MFIPILDMLRQNSTLRAISTVLALIFAVIAGTIIFQMKGLNDEVVGLFWDSLSRYNEITRSFSFSPVSDGDLPRLLPLLDAARDLTPARAPSASWQFGLSQNAKLHAGADEVYHHALNHALLPRLIWRLETQMRDPMNQPDLEATFVYLMLGSLGPLDRSLVRDWMMLDWQASYPGATAVQVSLMQHLDAMLSEQLPAVQLDSDLVAKAKTTISRKPLAVVAYSRIWHSAAARAVPPWLPSDALRPVGARVFLRLSGKPMNQGIPGFLTLDGFHRVLLPALHNAAQGVASESWVLGEKIKIDPNREAMARLEHDVVLLYEDDYIRAWDVMLEDLNVVPMHNVSQAASDLYILSSPPSPIRDLLTSIGRQTTLSVPPPDRGKTNAGNTMGSQLAAASERLQGLLSKTLGDQQSARPGIEVDVHFKPLHDLVSTGLGAPFDYIMKLLTTLQQQMAQLATQPAGSVLPPSDELILALRFEAQRQPPIMARWLNAIATGAIALRAGNRRR